MSISQVGASGRMGVTLASSRSGGWGSGERVLDGGDGGGRVEGAAGAAAQRAAPVGRALVLEPPLPAAGGRVLQPGQLEGQPGREGDLDQPAGPAPAGVAVLGLMRRMRSSVQPQ